MARRLRLLFEGGIYHVTFRGNRRQAIFRDDADRRRLLERLAESVETYGVRIYLYCLMANHVHLLVETPRGNLDRFMGSVLTGYTVYFNRRHRQVGHLFQGRYGAQVVAGDDYLLRLSRYIHLNPVYLASWVRRATAERRSGLRAYAWSSYAGYAGLRRTEEWMVHQPVFNLLPRHGTIRAEVVYRRYVEAGLAKSDEEFRDIMAERSLAVGDVAFREEMRRRYEQASAEARRVEDISFRRPAGARADPQKVKESVCRVVGCDGAVLDRRRAAVAERGLWAWALQKYAGLTQRQIATCLGLATGAAVSALLKRNRADARLSGWQQALYLSFEG
jgi:putative transposase